MLDQRRAHRVFLNDTRQSFTRNVTINNPNTITGAFFNSVLMLILETGNLCLLQESVNPTDINRFYLKLNLQRLLLVFLVLALQTMKQP